jgi:hypothetical protein
MALELSLVPHSSLGFPAQADVHSDSDVFKVWSTISSKQGELVKVIVRGILTSVSAIALRTILSSEVVVTSAGCSTLE